MKSFDETKFYLNYVGCKVYKNTQEKTQSKMFYLNYVGCKVFMRGLCVSVGGGEFYLNYVGCKVIKNMETLSIK